MANELKVNIAGQSASVATPSFHEPTTDPSFSFSTPAGLEAWIYWLTTKGSKVNVCFSDLCL
jgi:hypothetical protein